MKHLKQRLMAATAMLMVSAVMLTSVSYAWFTMSTNPEVKGMTATVTANENLEIALDNWYYAGEVANKPADADDAQISVDEASIYNNQPGVQGSTVDNPYTWGNLVDLSMAFNTLNGVATEGAAKPVLLNIQPMKFVAKGEMVPNEDYVVPTKDVYADDKLVDDAGNVWTFDTDAKVYKYTDDKNTTETTDDVTWTYDAATGVLKKDNTEVDATDNEYVTMVAPAVDETKMLDAKGNEWTTTDSKATYVRFDPATPTSTSDTGTKWTYTATSKALTKEAVIARAVSPATDPASYEWVDDFTTEAETIAAEIAAPTSLLQYPEYNKDGRVSKLNIAADTLFSAHKDFKDPVYKDGKLDTTQIATQEGVKGGVKAYSATSGIPNYYAFSVDYWIRSNVAGNVYLSKDAALRANDETTADTLDDDKDYSEVVNTVKGEGSYIKIPGENYGVVKYELDSANNKLIPKYTDEQLAINAYIENLVVKFAYSAGEKDYSVAAAFAEKSEYISGDNLGKIQPMLQNDFATVAEGETTPTFDTALLQKKVTPEGGSEITYYYLNATSVDEKGVATAKAAEACADLYIYLDNATEMVANPDYVENGTEPEEIEEKIPVVALERNKGQKVTMYVYLDGETVSNADALLSDLGGLQFNIQFTHETIGAGTETDGGAQPVDPRPTVTTP